MLNLESSKSFERYLELADEISQQHGIRLTKLRKMIFALLLQAEAPVKAYDLIDKMREMGKSITPTTIYRILDFLLSEKLIHKVNALNAYVSCSVEHQHEHSSLMVICSQCETTEEIDDTELTETINNKLNDLGVVLQDNCIEIQGVCKKCQE